MAEFSTSWDVDKYKNSYESEEHWQLRRQFMVAHKDKFPEFRLVCLTQVFFNMEFLGCKYPEKTMELVNRLANEVAEEFRESRKGKLKRTFVGAQDAAGAKAKGMKPPPGATQGSQIKQDVVEQPTKKPRLDQEDDEPPPIKKETSDDSDYKKFEAGLREMAKTFVLMFPPRSNSKLEQDPMRIMHFNFPGKSLNFRIEGTKKDGWNVLLRVNPEPLIKNTDKAKHAIASAFSLLQKDGKIQACTIAIENLKKFCTYIEPNPEWFADGRTPEFIEKRIPCSKSPRTYLIMTKEDTGFITAEVADNLLKTFKQSCNEDMFFIDTEFGEKEKINLMNRVSFYDLSFRHFGSKTMLKDHHVCVYKNKSAAEIVEEARRLNWKHPKYIVTLKKS